MENKYSIKFVLAMMLFAVLVTCLIAVIVFTGLFVSFRNNNIYIRDYATLLDMIDRLYIGEYEEDYITAIAMKAAVESLYDGWSYYLTPAEFAYFMDDTSNQYVGIGVNVVVDEATGGIGIDFVHPDSPADEAGIVAGDVIIAIDGQDITAEEAEDARVLLYREIGETVELTILHEDGSTGSFTIVFAYVFLDPISFEMLSYDTSDIGYIRIRDFDDGAAGGFIPAAFDLVDQGACALIIDVRYNGGGRVTEMTDILDFLLPQGEIFIEVDKNGMEFITESDPEMLDIPCVVLVDQNSYSAAEYFAATLSEYDYAIIVGEQTTGKSRVQSTFKMPGGGALHISTSNYLTRNRVDLHNAGGLTPDYQIVLTDEEYDLLMANKLDKDADPQLAKALELLAS